MSTYAEIVDLVLEASHGKLKYDFRAAFDYDTGHALKIVYDLAGVKVDDIGDGYMNASKTKDSKEKVVSDIQKNIAKKGNMDHKSHGQKILTIIDRVTGKKLDSANIVGPHCDYVNQSRSGHSNMELNVDRLHKAYNANGGELKKKYVKSIKAGAVDNSSTFKTTKWMNHDTSTTKRTVDGKVREVKNDETIPRRTEGESLKYGRGAKANDLRGTYMPGQPALYNHPSKKDKKQNKERYNAIEKEKKERDSHKSQLNNLMKGLGINLFESADDLKLSIYESWYNNDITSEERDLLIGQL